MRQRYPWRRICWPFDAVCLQGGCIHCNDHRHRSLATIWRQAVARGLHADFVEGEGRGWGNAEVRLPPPDIERPGPRGTG